MIKKTTLACTYAFALGTSAATAIDIAPLQTGYIYDTTTSVEGSGDVSSQFFHISGSKKINLNSRSVFLKLSASYYNNNYDFSGGPLDSFTQLEPWNQVHTFNIGANVIWRMNNEWNLFFLPTIRSAGESGAKFSDTFTTGALLGASYTVNDRLSIGPGVGCIGQIEDNASIFPILLIKWQLTDSLSLSTGSTVGATLGPGIALKWDINDDLRFTFGTRAERTRFRLSESNDTNPNGIGEDNSIPVYGMVTYQVNETLQTSFIAGIGISNDFVLDNSSGNRVTKKDYDSSPFMGINLGFNF